MLAMQKLKEPIWLRAALCCYNIEAQVLDFCDITLQYNPLGTVIFLIYGLLVFSGNIRYKITTILTISFANTNICRLHEKLTFHK